MSKATATIGGFPCIAWAQQTQKQIPVPGGRPLPGMIGWYGAARFESREAVKRLVVAGDPHIYSGPIIDLRGKERRIEGAINISRYSVSGMEIEFEGAGTPHFSDAQSADDS